MKAERSIRSPYEAVLNSLAKLAEQRDRKGFDMTQEFNGIDRQTAQRIWDRHNGKPED